MRFLNLIIRLKMRFILVWALMPESALPANLDVYHSGRT